MTDAPVILDDETRIVALVAKVISGCDRPALACMATIRLSGNALVKQYVHSWVGHEIAAREHRRQAEFHEKQARIQMPILRRAR